MRIVFTILFLLFITLTPHAQSVLSSGKWYKIGITQTGIYKIDKDFLSSTGINPDDIDPQKLQLFGTGGGGMLPQANNIKRPNDPQEMALYSNGTQDGSFDNTDYFLFFSKGPDLLEIDEEGNPIYEKNIYSDTVYYFLTIGNAPGKRLETIEASSGSNPSPEFAEYFVHEIDEYNQLSSGRRWLGESFSTSNQSRSFNFEFENTVSSADWWISVGANLESASSFRVTSNNLDLGNIPLNPIPDDDYNEKIKYNDAFYETSPNSTDLELTLSYDGTARGSGGYLDYFILRAKHPLHASNSLKVLRIPEGNTHSYIVQNMTSDTQLWDVSDPTHAKSLALESLDISGQFENTPDQTTFILFQGSDFPNPTFFQAIANQNIKSLAAFDGVIITAPKFLPEAERLAEFHRSYDNLSVAVVTTRQIYNEFSSGAQDLTSIRDFVRHHYLKNGRVKYALLFGDASYDYKYRASVNTNYVPVYESHESSHNLFSHSSDDFIGFMEEDEGIWDEGVRQENRSSFSVAPQDHTLEIGVGRLPAKTLDEAEIMVDKIIRYKEATQSFGKWRTTLAYLADDGDNNEHMKQSEIFNTIIDTGYYEYHSKRIYLDSYDQSGEPGRESPISQAVIKTLKEGALIFDYMGHGNTEQLTDFNEIAINIGLIQSLTNRHKLPLFVTATCEFGRYDNPVVVSGAEYLLLNANGGSIGLLSTTRAVYAHTNEIVNIAFHENVFKRIRGELPRLGDVMVHTKNESTSGLNNRNFALLADPMLQLNYPAYDISLDQMVDELDTLSALERYTVSGHITNDGVVVSKFNGKAIITIWDIPQEKITQGDENPVFTFSEQTNTLYRGEFTVKDGTFETTAILPKNTSYKYEPGKITLYAWSEDDMTDASTGTKNFVLGGTASELLDDQTPPTISIYLNDSSFRSGGTVGTSSLLIAQLSDENGINISNNGFNQGLTLQLNNQDPISMNEYYTTHQDTYQSGTVLFPLENLAPGTYTATLKVSDSYNNSRLSTVEFKVSANATLRLFNTKNYPNPVSSNGLTTFSFTHDREGEELEIKLRLYDMHGSTVNQWEYQVDNSPREVDNLTLHMTSSRGGSLRKGVYLCKLTVRSTLDGASSELIKRILIIN